jgi:hypothetical protein
MSAQVLAIKNTRCDDLLDLLPDIVRAAGYAIWSQTGVSPKMTIAPLIGLMSAAAGPLFTVSAFGRPHHPISVPTLTIGDSGTGKSLVHDRLIPPFVRHAADSQGRFRKAMTEHEACIDEWKLAIHEREKALKAFKGDARVQADIELASLRRQKPCKPKDRPRLIDHVDFEGLLKLLDGENEAVDIFSTEGDKWLKRGILVRNANDMNSVHDGTNSLSSHVERKASLVAQRAHLGITLMVRRGTLDRYLPTHIGTTTKKSELVNTGFFARFHVSVINEKPGPIWEMDNPSAAEDLARLHRRVSAMLRLHRQRLANGRSSRVELSISDDTRQWWEWLCQQIRGLEEGELARIDEYAGKMLGMTVRIACLIHVFESRSRVVSLSALQRAWLLVRRSADDYMRVFAPPPPEPQADQDEAYIFTFLRNEGRQLGDQVRISDIAALTSLPTKRVTAALLRLQGRGRLYVDSKRGIVTYSHDFLRMGYQGK